MSSETPASRPAATSTPAPAGRYFHWGKSSLSFASRVSAIMMLLALIGIGLATAKSGATKTYWIAMVPTFGILCIATAWYRQGAAKTEVVRQILHWAGITVAIGLDFGYISAAGEETPAAAGKNALLLLAVGCFLAGVHLEWLFMIVGAMLGGMLIIIVVAEQYLPIVIGIGIVVILAILFFARRQGRQTA